jgi:hypothetical protein
MPLAPYIDQGPLWEIAQAGDPANGIPRGGPEAWSGWAPWNVAIPGLLCPSDPYGSTNPKLGTDYAFSVGDSIVNLNGGANIDLRGAFATTRCYAERDFTDGASNVIMLGERCRANFGIGAQTNPPLQIGTTTNLDPTTNPGVCLTNVTQQQFTNPTTVKGRFGTQLWDGQAERCAFNTILPPNAPGCMAGADVNADSTSCVLPASSHHAGGVHCLMGDGRVVFISENINTGNLAAAPVNSGPSPYGVWGALGSKNGTESVGEF